MNQRVKGARYIKKHFLRLIVTEKNNKKLTRLTEPVRGHNVTTKSLSFPQTHCLMNARIG